MPLGTMEKKLIIAMFGHTAATFYRDWNKKKAPWAKVSHEVGLSVACFIMLITVFCSKRLVHQAEMRR